MSSFSGAAAILKMTRRARARLPGRGSGCRVGEQDEIRANLRGELERESMLATTTALFWPTQKSEGSEVANGQTQDEKDPKEKLSSDLIMRKHRGKNDFSHVSRSMSRMREYLLLLLN